MPIKDIKSIEKEKLADEGFFSDDADEFGDMDELMFDSVPLPHEEKAPALNGSRNQQYV